MSGPQRKQERLDALRAADPKIDKAYTALKGGITHHYPNGSRSTPGDMRPLQEILLNSGLNRFDARDLANFAASSNQRTR